MPGAGSELPITRRSWRKMRTQPLRLRARSPRHDGHSSGDLRPYSASTVRTLMLCNGGVAAGV
jgi:hypothetical protein